MSFVARKLIFMEFQHESYIQQIYNLSNIIKKLFTNPSPLISRHFERKVDRVCQFINSPVVKKEQIDCAQSFLPEFSSLSLTAC